MFDELKFEIEILQRSKTILATESVLVNSFAILAIYLTDKYIIDANINSAMILCGVTFAMCYSIWASIGNIKRHLRINKLLKDLDFEGIEI